MSVSMEQARTVQQGMFGLRDALSELSKDALTMIRKNAAVKNASKLNREQLIDALIEQLPHSLALELPAILHMMDDERITLLEQAAAKNGMIAVGEEWTELMTLYWQELGLLFRRTVNEREVMAMPAELVPVVQQALAGLDRKLIALNTTYLSVVKGMVYYYGVLTHEQIGDITGRYGMFQQLQAPYMHIIIHYRRYRADFGLNETMVHHYAIPDPTLIVREQSKRDSLSFASYTLLQLQEAGKPHYIARSEAHRLLVEALMKQFKLPQFEANLVADQTEFGIRAGLQLQDLLEYVRRELQLDEAALQQFVPRLIIMYNNTPQWCLKGYSASQLSKDGDAAEPAPEQQTKAAAEPGRNDPCYCGSGKKYKKCCINN